MKLLQISFFALMCLTLTPSCNSKGSNTDNSATSTEKTEADGKNQSNTRRGPDYDALKQELGLTEAQEKQFNETLEKYRLISEANRASYTGADGKVDRVIMFDKMDEVRKQQSAEMTAFLNEDQLKLYEDFMAKNTRKRPGYSDELLTRIKTELALDETQSKMLEAVNKAFEKSFHDAHDYYHGNPELAAEYRAKYDEERKNALKQVFSEEQYKKYLDIVEEDAPAGK